MFIVRLKVVQSYRKYDLYTYLILLHDYITNAVFMWIWSQIPLLFCYVHKL